MAFSSYRQESKGNYGTNKREDESCSIEQLNAGSLQRIADATEKIALNYDTLLRERNQYKEWYYQKVNQLQSANNSTRSLKGVITKLKKKNKL